MKEFILPLLRYEDDPEIIPGAITEVLAEYLYIVYVRLQGDRYELLQQADLTKLDLWQEELRLLSQANLRRLLQARGYPLPVDCALLLQNAPPFFRLSITPDWLTPSLLLLDEIWENASRDIATQLVAVTLPAKALLFYADAANETTFNNLNAVARGCYALAAAEERPLSPDTYVRVAGHWQRFQDTEAQWFEWIEQL